MARAGGDDTESTNRRAPARRSLWALACLSAGLVLGREAPGVPPWAWWAGALALVALAAAGRQWLCRVALAGAVVLLGAGWMDTRTARWPAGSLGALVSPGGALEASSVGGALMVLEGVVLETPRLESPRRVPADLPWTPAAVSRFGLLVVQAGEHDGPAVPAWGVAQVTVRGPAPGVRAGDLVRLTAVVRPIAAPLNPGEPDQRPAARQDGVGARALVDSAALIVPCRADLGWWAEIRSIWARQGALLRGAAGAALLAGAADDEPGSLREQGRAMLSALLLGQYEPAGRDVGEAFRRLGLLHALAISGFHLSVMAGLALYAVRLTGDRGALEPLAVAAMVVVYLAVVPAEAPVVRSGLMVLALLAAECAGRRYDRLSVLGWVGVALLVWRPLDLWSLGFQLSWGVTAALLWLGRRTHEAWFGGERLLGGYERDEPALRRAWRWLRQGPVGATLSASVLAWAVATPLIAWHTGWVSTLGWLFSVVMALPIVLAIGLGYAALVAGAALGWVPGVADGAAWLLEALGSSVASVVLWLDGVPGTVWVLPEIPVAWALGATLVALAVFRWGPRIADGACLAGAGLCLWLVVVLAQAGRLDRQVAVRVDALAVGQGPCLILRSGDQAVLIDGLTSPGSATLPAARRVHGAARALGCWRVRTAIVRRNDAAELALLTDLVEPLGIADVLVPPRLSATIGRSPASEAARWAERLRSAGVRVRPMEPGQELAIGGAIVRWRDNGADADGDGPPAVSIEVLAAGRVLRLDGSATGPSGGAAPLESVRADAGAWIVSARRAGEPARAWWPWRDGAAWAEVDGRGRLRTGALHAP
ncbi:MAG: ComEC/Rec2 family competence protein [Phycisphaeraceae bacterium]|nr:ComEC/Rec2 family competence protein [Phycisphaeraceae bacterium]